jgi:choline dehydrogenase
MYVGMYMCVCVYVRRWICVYVCVCIRNPLWLKSARRLQFAPHPERHPPTTCPLPSLSSLLATMGAQFSSPPSVQAVDNHEFDLGSLANKSTPAQRPMLCFPFYRNCMPCSSVQPSYTHIIVGGGSSGACLASRLSENPHFTVLLLEAGPDAVCHRSLWPPSVQLPGGVISPEGALFDYHMVTTPQEGLCHGTQPGRKVIQPRGYILSGSSALNYMLWVRGAPAFYDEFWGDGWRFADVGPYFAKAEHYDHPERGALRGYDGPTSVMNAEDDDLPKIHKLFLEASEALSRENGDKPYTRRNRDYNDAESALGASAAQWNIKNGIRESTAMSYLTPEVRRRPNLTILANSFVTRLELKDGRCAGVHFRRGQANLNSGDNERHTMSSLACAWEQSAAATTEVCLCGGAYQSPQLLMVSGIGPKLELDRHGIRQIVESPHVGEDLQDHLMTRLMFHIEDEAAFQQQFDGFDSSYVQGMLFTCTDGTGIPDIQFMMAYIPWGGLLAVGLSPFFQSLGLTGPFWHEYVPAEAAKKPLCMFFPCLNQPKSRGRVSLHSGSALDYPKLEMGYLSEQADVDTFVKAQNLMRSIIRMGPLKGVIGEEVVNKELPGWQDPASKEYNEAYARSAATTVFHPTSTCAIGKVVDEELRVKGVSGLRVADASVMKKIVPGNTNWPCIAIAEKAADLMKAHAAAEDGAGPSAAITQ